MFMAFTSRNMAKATMMKSRITASRLPMPRVTGSAPAATAVLLRMIFHWVRSMPPGMRPMSGMMMSLTREVVILPKAAPMTTPMAMSRTLPRMANSLNS